MNFCRRLAVTLLLAVMTVAAAGAKPFIKDVMLIGGDKTDVLKQFMTYYKQGWSLIDKDLNDGADGDYILLLCKPDSYDDGFNYGCITGFYISNEFSRCVSYKGRTYYPVPCAGGEDFVDGHGDLNEGSGGDYIYLYYTRDPFSDHRAVNGITFNTTKTGAVGLSGDDSEGYDLNSKAGGDFIYMHVATATALTPLRIGDGSSGTNVIPFYLGNEYYPYSLSQQIYTAEEIGTAGTISAISFYHRTDNTSLSMTGVQIFMKHTDKDSFTGAEMDPIDDFDKVYDGAISVSGPQWMTIHLDKPFEYDGNRNLMICCCDPTGVHPQGNTFTYHPADNKMRRKATHDPINLQEKIEGTPNTTLRNDIQLNITPNLYRNPASLSVTGFTDKSASLTWKAPQGTHPTIRGYKWQYKASDAASWSVLNSTSGTTASLSGLSAFKEYLFRVKAVYDGGESSYSILRFFTALSLPYTCGFENGMPGWSQVDYKHYMNVDYTGISGDARHDGAYGYMFEGYSENPVPQYLISPGLPGDVPIGVSFFFRNYAAPNFETFQLGYSTTTCDIAAFTWGEEITDDDTDWRLYEDHFPTGTQYVAVKYVSNKYRLFLDDFEFVAYSSYGKPTGLSVSGMTDQRATLNWTAPEGAGSYACQYRQVDVGDWSPEETVTGTSVTLENLSANTTYDFRIKALFGKNASNYVTLRFMTEGPEESLPHYQDFENGMGGWRLEDGHHRSGISTREHHGGSYSFEFDEGSPHAQYLRSPLLDGNSQKVVSFYYRIFTQESSGSEIATGYSSAFQVGWSTKTSSLNDFVEAPEVRADNGHWNRYSLQVPEGVKYVFIKVKDHEAWLYVDDISITEVPRPVARAATVMGETRYATTFYDGARKWRLPKGAHAYTVEKEGEDHVFYCIDDIIPAGTPVIILMDKTTGDTGDTKELKLSVTADSGKAPYPDNILKGTDLPVAVSGGKIDDRTVYVLGILNGKLGFYQFSGAAIPAGKAYYLGD